MGAWSWRILDVLYSVCCGENVENGLDIPLEGENPSEA